MSDFLNWDDSDVDLSELLDEWTEYEVEIGSDSWTDGSDTENRKPVKRSKTASCSKVSYMCPLCKKTYSSVSGFRGHVVKKHQRGDLKAAANRYPEPTVPNSPKAEQQTTKPSTSKEIFCLSKVDCLKLTENALAEVRDNQNNNASFSTRGSSIIHVSRQILESKTLINNICELIYPKLQQVFSAFGSSTTFSLDRELMWSRFHSMRMDFEFIGELVNIAAIVTASVEIINIFFQCFLDDFMKVAIHSLTDKIEKESEREDSFNDQDNSILYYISGYLIAAMEKKARKQEKQTVRDALENLHKTSTSESPKFIKKFKWWTEKVNRGGLKMCSDNFFFMIRKMEMIIRKLTDQMTKGLPSKIVTKEEVMTDTVVKYYWDELLTDSPNNVKLSILEDVVELFIRVRGHATAKLVQRLTMKTHAMSKKGKKSHSLRRSLKENCN